MSSIFMRSPSESRRIWMFSSSSTCSSVASFASVASKRGRGISVDLPQQQEAVGRRQIPPELRLLPHDQRDLPAEGVVALPRAVAEHPSVAGRGMDDPRQHLDQRRLARPVRSHQPEDLALGDLEGHLAHRVLGELVALEQGADRPQQAGGLAVHVEVL